MRLLNSTVLSVKISVKVCIKVYRVISGLCNVQYKVKIIQQMAALSRTVALIWSKSGLRNII